MNSHFQTSRWSRSPEGEGCEGDEVYTIGFEGSGTTEDECIRAITCWEDEDEDAPPLPDELPGFTGRLAVSQWDGEGYTLTEVGDEPDSFAAHFDIEPGCEQQLFKVPESVVDTGHYSSGSVPYTSALYAYTSHCFSSRACAR